MKNIRFHSTGNIGTDRHDCVAGGVTKPAFSHFRRAGKRTILVPVDFTEASDAAIDHALKLAEDLGASVVLVHVLEQTYAEGFLDTPAKTALREEALASAKKRLDATIRKRGRCLAPIERVVIAGKPEYEILNLAEDLNVDLIVLGRRRMNLLGRWLFGSVSKDILDVANCPVVLVKSPAHSETS